MQVATQRRMLHLISSEKGTAGVMASDWGAGHRMDGRGTATLPIPALLPMGDEPVPEGDVRVVFSLRAAWVTDSALWRGVLCRGMHWRIPLLATGAGDH
ncbi:hypothetical protein [Desulfovibrio ferrophilus]|uniref:hypothetical protein n=1 Tax=Desulfovibrio ferrophilus TaxID=241368 RepID=UPI001561CF00|nr:hypothetical protein [Desulfovibrio ferrophilus]